MKLNSITRFGIVAMTILGSVVVVTSQPTVAVRQQGEVWPTHKMIPASVPMSQMQEFKDAATLHLNDLQKFGPSVGADCVARGVKARVAISTTIMRDFFTSTIVVISDLNTTPGAGAGPHVKKMTPADVACMYYAFDQGIDLMARTPGTSNTAGTIIVTPTFITGHMSPKDMGMTDSQFRQMASHYVETHPMRFWNEARVGLASGR